MCVFGLILGLQWWFPVLEVKKRQEVICISRVLEAWSQQNTYMSAHIKSLLLLAGIITAIISGDVFISSILIKADTKTNTAWWHHEGDWDLVQRVRDPTYWPRGVFYLNQIDLIKVLSFNSKVIMKFWEVGVSYSTEKDNTVARTADSVICSNSHTC